MSKKKIVHIINSEKFTTGYINFITLKLPEYEHSFIVYGRRYEVAPQSSDGMIRLPFHRNILSNAAAKSAMYHADTIILSGIFGIERFVMLYPQSIWDKICLQFWGGDIYSYRTPATATDRIHKAVLRLAIKRCKAVINLIPNDYDELKKVFGTEKRHYTAEMPLDPLREKMIENCVREAGETGDSHTIILGNSATKENHHIEMLETLKNVLGNDARVLCPLSYGDEAYRAQVCESGVRCLGDRFVPVVEYMEYGDYVKLLNSCAVGIFNNDRQQALGNIHLLAKLGKKVYLRTDTAMWPAFQAMGLSVYPVEEIEKSSEEELFRYTEKEREQNRRALVTHRENIVTHWKAVLDQ